MKLSELIEELSDMKAKHGDLIVDIQDLGSDWPTVEVIEDVRLCKEGRYWATTFVALVGNKGTFLE